MVPGCVPFKNSPTLHSRWLLFFKVMIISLWNLLQYHSIVRWAIQAQWAEPLVLIEVGFFYDIDLGLPVLLTYVGVKLSVKWCDWTVILEYCFHLRENKIGQILPFLKARDYNYCPSIPPIISSFHFRRVILIRQRFCNLKKPHQCLYSLADMVVSGWYPG